MKSFFIMAILACSLVPAHADGLPSEMLGEWCFYVNTYGKSIYNRPGHCEPDPEVIVFDPKGYKYGAVDCRFTSIRPMKVVFTRTVANCTNTAETGKKTTFIDRQILRYIDVVNGDHTLLLWNQK